MTAWRGREGLGLPGVPHARHLPWPTGSKQKGQGGRGLQVSQRSSDWSSWISEMAMGLITHAGPSLHKHPMAPRLPWLIGSVAEDWIGLALMGVHPIWSTLLPLDPSTTCHADHLNPSGSHAFGGTSVPLLCIGIGRMSANQPDMGNGVEEGTYPPMCTTNTM